MVATAVLPMLEEQARERKVEGAKKGAAITNAGGKRECANLHTGDEPEEKHRSASDAASMLSVSPRSVATAKKVQQAAPELAEKVKSGEVTLNAAALPMLEEQAKERKLEGAKKGAAITNAGGKRECANLRGGEKEQEHRAADDAASMLSVSSRAVQTAKKVQQAAPYLRLLLGTAVSRGSGLTPCASKYPMVVSVRFTRAGLCRVGFTRRSFGGGGTGSKASALNIREHDRHRRKPTLSGRAALCHDWQCGHLRRGASLTPSAVVTMEVFSMGLPLVKCALHNGGAVIMALCVP